MKYKKIDNREPVQAVFVEVEASEVKGDVSKLIKRFMKKCKKEEVTKVYFDRMYHKTKSQKRREKDLKSAYKYRKQEKD